MIHLSDPPKDLDDNRDYRTILLAECDTPARQAEVIERCREDIVWWIDSWGWQYNPDNRGHEVEPFICYPFQEAALRKTMNRLLIHRRRVVWEKSRKLGASWLLLFLEGHQCLFFNRQKFLNLSHSEQAVDLPDNPDTLFWKLRFINDHLPGWMTRGARKRKLSFWYPGTNSASTGAATTERSGVGGRGTVIGDEFAKHPKGWQILGQTADTGPQLFCSSHYDVASAYYHLTQRPDAFKIVMHWKDHPDRARGLYRSSPALPQGYEILDKGFVYPPQCPRCSGLTTVRVAELTPCCEQPARDFVFITDGKPTGGPYPGIRSPYYDAECVERGNERDVALHLDINPQGAQSQFFDALLLRQLIGQHCGEAPWRGDLKYDPDSAEPIRLIEDDSGPLRLWLRLISDEMVTAGNYGAGCDISQGTGTTPSVCSIADATTGHKVAEFVTAQLPADRFAACIVALCKLFKSDDGQGALLSWETSGGPGSLFGKTVANLGYRRLMPRASRSIVRGAVNDVYGWVSNQQSKKALLEDYRAALRNHSFINRSQEAMEECDHYRYSDRRDAVEHPKDVGGDDPSVARSNHGDRVIADAICWMVLQYLGAGKPAKVREQEQPPPVNSLLWRREQRSRQRRAEGAWI